MKNKPSGENCEKCKAQIHAEKCHDKPVSHICGEECFYVL